MSSTSSRFDIPEDILDHNFGLDSQINEDIDLSKFETIQQDAYFPTPDEMLKATKKGLLYIGAEFNEDKKFVGHGFVQTFEYTMHQVLYATSGGGKTEKQKFDLMNLMIQKDMADTLNKDIKNPDDKIKVFDAFIFDNLGNFRNFGEPILQKNPEFLKFYLKSGWDPDYLRSLGPKWVRKYRPNYLKKVGLWRNAVVIPNLESIIDLLEYMVLLGAEVNLIRGQLYEVLDEMNIFDDEDLRENFVFKEFIEQLEVIKNRSRYEARKGEDSKQKEAGFKRVSIVDQVISPLKKLERKYHNVYDIPTFEDNKITIMDGLNSEDQWLFHISALSHVLENFVILEKNLQSIKILVQTDEYGNVIKDAAIQGTNSTSKRESRFANYMRDLILKLIAIGRNYGLGVYLATQNPGQMLIKEGRQFASIQNKWIGYLGTEIDKMRENNKGGSSFGPELETVMKESSKGGWISEKRTGQWLLIQDQKVRRILTWMPCYN